MLYACYDLIRIDVVMELSWRHGLTRFHHAIHDQFLEPAGCYDRDSQERQRGAKSAREVTREGGEQRTNSWWLTSHVDSRTCCRSSAIPSLFTQTNGFAPQPKQAMLVSKLWSVDQAMRNIIMRLRIMTFLGVQKRFFSGWCHLVVMMYSLLYRYERTLPFEDILRWPRLY